MYAIRSYYVKRIRGEMMAIIEEVGFEGSFQEFLEHLRTDPQFYFDNPDDLYREYLATSKRIDPELVTLFGKGVIFDAPPERMKTQLKIQVDALRYQT